MVTKFSVCIMTVIVAASAACAVTVTFDDVPSGTALRSTYAWTYDVSFSDDFRAIDHVGSPWGPPHSPRNVLTSVGSSFSWIAFSHGGPPVPAPHPVQSVSAYFGTDTGVMVRIKMHAYDPDNPDPVIGNVMIGAVGESWNNRYVEISTTPDQPFGWLEFEGVNSADDLLGFSADDMTITLVPEPSSLLALGGGLAGMAGLVLRRRRG